MPLNTKIGGLVKYVKDKETVCLTNDQARHIHKKVELEGSANVDTIKQEIEEDNLSKDNVEDDEVNQYHNININIIHKKNIITSQMQQWSVPSNVVNYAQYDRNNKNFYDVDGKAIHQKNHRKIYNRLKEEYREVLE